MRVVERALSIRRLLALCWPLTLHSSLDFLTAFYIDRLSLQSVRKWHTFKVLSRSRSLIAYNIWNIYFATYAIATFIYEACCSIRGFPYHYQDLNTEKQSIRVLSLFPGEFDDDIYCRLVHTSLEDRPSYEALSYTWGDVTKTRTIWIGLYPVQVSSNLYYALKHLRLRQEVRFLWVDAICLNQMNIKERNHQVKQMTAIYHNAAAVYVWLGTANSFENSDAALFFVEDLEQIAWHDHYPQLDDVHSVIVSMSALGKLCQRSWWKRAWVLQEIGVARGEIFVQCGLSRWPWMEFVNGARLMKHFKSRQLLLPPHAFPTIAIDTILQFDQIRDWRSIEDDNSTLLRLLEHTRGREATDSRDNVYAILGLALKSEVIGFEPDYTKSTCEVYTEVASHIIKSSRKLSVLGSKQGHPHGGLPSWVPDWSKSYRGYQLLCDRTPYAACGKTAINFRFSGNSKLLLLQGAQIDSILSVHKDQSNERYPENRESMLSGFIDFLEALDGSKCPYDTKNGRSDAIWRTLIADSSSEREFPALAPFRWSFEVAWLANRIRMDGNNPTLWDELGAIVLDCTRKNNHGIWVKSLRHLKQQLDLSQRNLRLMDSQKYLEDIPENRQLLSLPLIRIPNPRQRPSRISRATLRSRTPSQRDTPSSYVKHLAPRAPHRVPPPVPDAPPSWKRTEEFSRPWTSRMHEVMEERNLFRGTNGFIGLAPATACEGDIVCVMLGCDVPLILRERDDHYELVGDAYVHGFMEGEAINRLGEGLYELQVFVLD
jgi:hypothetical protein